jgi:hypothetical protein
MKKPIRASFARATRIALAAAIVAAVGAGAGAASAGAATGCTGLQGALDASGISGATVVLDEMCTGSYTLSPNATFTLEGAPGTNSGFDGTGATSPLLGNLASTEAGAMTLSHLTFKHSNLKEASALSIRASRVTLSDDSFLENKEQGEGAHAAFVQIGPSGCGSSAGAAAALTVTDSVFSKNKLLLGAGKGGGAGAWLEDSCEPSRNVIDGNNFEANTLEAQGTAEEVQVAGAGLVFVGGRTQPAPVSQSANVFDSNKLLAPAPDVGDYGGGGEWLEDASLLSVGDRFSRNEIAGTSSGSEAAWSWGAGLGIDNLPLACNEAALTESTLDDAAITGNAIGPGRTGALGGGGMWVGCTHLRVLDSTVTLNSAPIGAGIEGEPGDQLELANSIVAEDSPGGEIAGFNEAGGSRTISSSDVCVYAGSSEPLPGTGNICANPLLADNGNPISLDVHETASSPTIDAGSNALVPTSLTTDFYGTSRILAGHLECTDTPPAVVDMGADEFIPPEPSCPTPRSESSPSQNVAPLGSQTSTSETDSASAAAAAQSLAATLGLAHFVSLKLTSSGIALRLSCSSADDRGCAGTIYVTSEEKLRGKKVVAVGASDSTKASVRLGQASFSLPTGATGTFRVKLNSTGLALLHHFHAISAWVSASQASAANRQVIFLMHATRLVEPTHKREPSKREPKRH